LFDADGAPKQDLLALCPRGEKRMSATRYANGGQLLRELELPDCNAYALDVPKPGAVRGEATRVLGQYLRDVMRMNDANQNFRLFGPDEVASNRLDAVFEVSQRTWFAERTGEDDHLARDGRVMEILSEHLCEGWLEGYLLTGRHGLFTCYEAFIHIIDSMFNQHAKWIKVAKEVAWREPIASLNILLTSHVWRQDHNGFSHQDPGFIDVVMNKKADTIRVFLPPDANTLLAVGDWCLRSRDLVNVIVAGKQPQAQWLDMKSALSHCQAGIGVWDWASNDRGDPQLVMACAGDVPTLETLAAVGMLRELAPELRVRVVNVVDLMTLQPSEEHPHGLSDPEFDALFTTNRPILFDFHGYPWLIHRLTYRRTNHHNLHVRGYKEEGTTTTPFDMAVLNDIDRYHLLLDVVRRVPEAAPYAERLTRFAREKLEHHARYIVERGEDLPEVRDWYWRQGPSGAAGGQAGD
jgi:xylulose-5-phosphate/fructose-6-phosphate phosphoketolase